MSKSNGPNSLSEAISNLESAGTTKAQELKTHLEKDYTEIQKALETLKPLLEDFKDKAETEAKATKHQIEDQVKNNPWVTLGAVGVVAFIIGWIFGSNRK
jgi:ElaB/YqjD/DUF883 family membrane-anchored ribosome-binding protein